MHDISTGVEPGGGEPGGSGGEVELVVDAHAQVGEGPVWDPRARRLIWTDILGQMVHAYDPVSRDDYVVRVDQPVGAIALRQAGGHIAAVRDGFAALDLGSGQLEVLARVETEIPNNRMNDGKCDRAGRFWAGTMANDATPGRGALYRLDADHRVTRVFGNVTISNGLAWSPDNSTMYYVDTGRDRIDAFDFDVGSGSVERLRTLVAFDPAGGRPDGIAIDADGYLWVALAGGWCIRRYAIDGTLDREVRLPARLVTSCAFGGDDMRDLYITTAGYDVPPDDPEQPSAGGLFRFRPCVGGLAPDLYLG